MPGGNSRHTVYFPPHPIYVDRAFGSRIVDVDGVDRLDCVNNYSSLIHGHRHPAVIEAIHAQAERLVAVGAPTETEIALAEHLVQRVPAVEHVRFTNSGTEAVMMAVKAARAFTGRPKIAKFEGCYHGTYDPVEISQAPDPLAWGPAAAPYPVALSRGTPPWTVEGTIVLPFNDVEAAARIVSQNRDSIAGVIVDPAPSHLGYIPVNDAMFSMLRDFCASEGSLFILDEVYSLRLAYGGYQSMANLRPDITVMGKIIGGGLPIGAVAGLKAVMAVFDPRATAAGPALAHGGTYNANPLSMAAGLASMSTYSAGEVRRLAELGDHVRSGLRDIARSLPYELTVTGLGSLIAVTFGPEFQSYRDRALFAHHPRRVRAFHRSMLEAGMFIAPHGTVVLSTAMQHDEVDLFLSAAEHVLRQLD